VFFSVRSSLVFSLFARLCFSWVFLFVLVSRSWCFCFSLRFSFPQFSPLFKLSCTARSASLFSPSHGSAFFFSGFISRECHRYPGNKVTVIAGLMAMHRWASVFFFPVG